MKAKIDLVEIVLAKPDNFLILKETLTRIGLPNRDNTKLFQTCHILSKKGKFYLVHFKELFILDGKPNSLSETDISRRNSIVNYLLHLWLFSLASGAAKMTPYLARNNNEDFTIIPYADRAKWQLVPKYVIGAPQNKPKKGISWKLVTASSPAPKPAASSPTCEMNLPNCSVSPSSAIS